MAKQLSTTVIMVVAALLAGIAAQRLKGMSSFAQVDRSHSRIGRRQSLMMRSRFAAVAIAWLLTLARKRRAGEVMR